MMGLPLLEYLSLRGYLKEGSRILDIGSQNLMNCTVEGMTAFVKRHRQSELSQADHDEIARLYYFSTPRPGERTLFLSEFLALTDIGYRGVDVCPAPETDIVDLNWQQLPANQRHAYDVVLNLGTTEHIVGQMNSMVYIHEALKPDGIFLHQPPSVGWVNHGYFAYHPQFFYDIAAANDYKIEEIWYSQSTAGPVLDATLELRDANDPLGPALLADNLATNSLYYNLNVVLRKTTDAPFRVGLELATSHSAVDENVSAKYADRSLAQLTVDEGTAAASEPSQALSLQVHAAQQSLSLQQHDIHQSLSKQLYSAFAGTSLAELRDEISAQLHAVQQSVSAQQHDIHQNLSRQIYESVIIDRGMQQKEDVLARRDRVSSTTTAGLIREVGRRLLSKLGA